MNILPELEWRGLVHQVTAEDFGEILASKPITLYTGYDPTAASLHVGHLLPLTLMRHFQRGGHQVVALMGGGTGQIGDPSGKSAERNLLDPAQAAANVRAIQAQITRYLDRPENPPRYRDNIEWLGPMGLLEFLRDTGKHFSVNAMIQKDSVRTRIEREGEGISFTEFSYSLLQARDFLELYRREGCTLQTGGSDQWGNIVAGTDLIRRVEGVRAFGLTVPLLVNSDGKKFGKSEQGAIFLDPALTSPYEFYQFWLNVADEDVARYLKLFTFLTREEIAELESQVGSGARVAQKSLARSMTELVHGSEEADKAVGASEALFGGDIKGLPVATLNQIFADVPAIEIPSGRAAEGIPLVDLLVETGACPSKSDARRQLQQGAVRINGDPAGEDAKVTPIDFLDGAVLVLKRGKRNTYLVRLAG